MSERAVVITEAPPASLRRNYAIRWQQAYVPLMTLLLVTLFGTWLLYEAEPLLTKPPEQRRETGVNPQFSADEAKLAAAVIEPGLAARGGREQLLFIGNSQTMAVPYAQPWDISTPQWFQVLLSRQSPNAVDVHRGSLGGITWPETVVRVVEFGESTSAPATVIVNLRPEMLGDLTIRNEVQEEARRPEVAAALRNLLSSDQRAAQLLASLQAPEIRQSTAGGLPWPTRLETELQSQAEGSPLFAERDLFVEMVNITLRKYRNRLFGVNSASVRPLDSSIYATNLALLSALLRYGREKGLQIVLYLGPLRSIQPNPNPAGRINVIRHDVGEIATRYGVRLLDYTDLVPEGFWTDYEPSRLNELTGDAGQPDFAHFREAAHRLIAERLVHDVGEQVLQSSTRR